MTQFSFEVFSFNGNKLSKYRVSYGSMPSSYDPLCLLRPSKKEKMLAKVKELNYAWAGQPDFEKIASLFTENAEYKIYRWKDKRCFTFDKHNFASEFRRSLEEEFVITSVVPFDVSCEAQYILGSYVYHLECKHDNAGQRYIWVSTCIYSFDQDSSIKKISQQGELHSDGDTLIPFQVHSKEKLRDRFFKSDNAESHTESDEEPTKSGLSIFLTEFLNFSFDIIVFGSNYSPFAGHIKGLSQLNMLEKIISSKRQTTEKGKAIDVFEDLDSPCYDDFIVIDSNKGTIDKEDCPFRGKQISFYCIIKFSFENGKLAKILLFPCPIPDAIPSPFDDISYADLNFRPKSEFL